MEARRRLPVRQRLPGRPVHAARLGVLDPVRHEHHVGRARLGAGPLPDRLRHRGCARRARRPRCRGQRGVPRRDAGRSVPARRRGRSRQRARARQRQLPLLRHVQRPGRQRLAAAGDHRRGCPAGSTPPRRHSHRRRTWRARFGVRRPPTASTRSAPGSATRTGPTGTPRTWSPSRPARSCRRERLRRDRHRRRLARRALRRRARRRRPARRARRARAGRGRVLLLGVHPVEDAAASRRGGARAANDAAATAEVDVEAALAWRDFMVSNYSDAGQERWLADHGIDLLRGRGRLAGPASSRSTAFGTRPSTSSSPTAPTRSCRRSRACASSRASGRTAR